MDRSVVRSILLSAAGVWFAGCAATGPHDLTSSAFMPASNPGPSTAPAPIAETITPATLQSAEPMKPSIAVMDSPTTAPISVIDSPATMPATPALQEGSYMTLGGIVAEVNGTPIYANTILAKVDKEFAAKAKEMDPETFERFARYELDKARGLAIMDEVNYAAAKRGLSAEDAKIIDYVMAQFLQQRITQAGGSIEMARRQSLATGVTFEQMLHQHSREITYDLYIQHHLMPLVQVTANDMREFYKANVNRLYTEKNQAKFRVIKIDPARIGGENPKAAALARIKAIRAKAARGDDFATLASTENHDDYLKARGGDPGGWIEKDAYRIDGIDKAIWKIEPGQVTEPVEDGGSFYIAKLEDRKIGRTQPFDDPALQSDVLGRLRAQQIKILNDQLYKRMLSEAVVRGDNDEMLLDPAVDIAKQKYPQWAATR